MIKKVRINGNKIEIGNTVISGLNNDFLEYIKDLQKKAELGDHYKHLYSEVKKQKDDVVEYCNKTIESLNWKKRSIMQILTPENGYLKADIEIEINKYKDLLRMLGEIDD